MSDAADDACVHPVGFSLQLSEQHHRVEWACLDCGRVFSWVDVEVAALDLDRLAIWCNRAGVSPLTWRRFENRMREEGRIA